MSGGIEFTCLLPVWAGDNPRHFAEALVSIARNSRPPTQTIICEDGELTPALERLAQGAARKFGVRRLRNPGERGLHHNLNAAARQVTTPWIARADADDINSHDRFEAQTRFLEANPGVDLVGGEIAEFWPDGRTRHKAMPLSHDDIVRYARYRSPINHMTAFLSTDALMACGGYPEVPLKEDYALWLTLIGRGHVLANLGQVLVKARLGADFYQRRAGLKNLASEFALFKIKRRVPGIGTGPAALAMVARSAALAFSAPARTIYEAVLRPPATAPAA